MLKNSFERAWVAPLLTDEVATESEKMCIHVADRQRENLSASVLTLDSERTLCTLSADVCDRLQSLTQENAAQTTLDGINSLSELLESLEAIGFILFSSDYVYYHLPDQLASMEGTSSTLSVTCRALSQEDVKQFESFIEFIDASEQGEAWVQLKHLKAYGLFVEGKLVSVCSAQPWSPDGKFQNDDINIAELGIITHPSYRRQGYAKRLIKSIAPKLAEQDYTLQFRPQNDNISAIHLAESLNLKFLGVSENLVWDGD